MKKLILSGTLIWCCLSFIYAQGTLDMIINDGATQISIPFEYENNFIIIKVVFNNTFPLKFIFDTGAEHTILTRREVTDILRIDYQRRFTILGADMKTELYAYLARGISLKTGNLSALNRSILVLEEDYFRFEEFAGVNVQGILGADFFRRFVVKIDYQRKMITLHDPTRFDQPSPKYFREYPIQLFRSKPYVQAVTHFQNDTSVNVKLLIDTGASLSLLLHTNTHPNLHLPPKVIRTNLAMGLGGTLEGFVGRVQQFDFGGYTLEGVTTNFQEILPGIDSTYLNERNGIIGNQLLDRFTILIDYAREKFYLSPSKEFRRKFQYDKSGLTLSASGPSLSTFTVLFVVPGSPADEAGVQVGDVIKRINWAPASFLALDDIVKKLKKKSGTRIKLVLKRGEEKRKVRFELRELI